MKKIFLVCLEVIAIDTEESTMTPLKAFSTKAKAEAFEKSKRAEFEKENPDADGNGWSFVLEGNEYIWFVREIELD